jgi:uncharacterized membrane protein YfhO
LRGIVVPRGQSRVTLEYVPFSFYAGLALSLVTAIGVLLTWILYWRSTRQPW